MQSGQLRHRHLPDCDLATLQTAGSDSIGQRGWTLIAKAVMLASEQAPAAA